MFDGDITYFLDALGEYQGSKKNFRCYSNNRN